MPKFKQTPSGRVSGGTVTDFAAGRTRLATRAVQLVDYYSDGGQTRHFLFRFPDFGRPGDDVWRGISPGEFLVLDIPGIGAAPFSFTYPPNQYGEFCVLVRHQDGVDRALFDMEVGSTLGARGPFGKPWPLAALRDERVLVVAAGDGLAPLVMLIDHLLTEHWCERLALVYGARDPEAQMLTPERERWQKQIDVFDTLEQGAGYAPPAAAVTPPYADANIMPRYPATSIRRRLSGTATEALPGVLARFGRPSRALLCGSVTMMRAAAAYLVAQRLPPSAIWVSAREQMSCVAGLCAHRYQTRCAEGPTFRWDKAGTWL
ncbi:hypothetical protein FKG94_08560 [Exilibacterium tricleocarpae]|uniref:FAD-binding FR-type domain-containing protein n=1 Tax=Exilibacterium tricleocarpae TaxID=2591008 RepID=A0A545TVG4_9GAMM|nr:hypothetical protein [Exilibacterium tricleocarpae]TQV81151.1 hypothetical protein FKG94_08560 [Exilibacterium tricleocarpae]